eukprot:gene43194-53613_t
MWLDQTTLATLVSATRRDRDTGQWVNDKKHGHGASQSRSKRPSLYVGGFVDDFRNGLAVCKYNNGDVYN